MWRRNVSVLKFNGHLRQVVDLYKPGRFRRFHCIPMMQWQLSNLPFSIANRTEQQIFLHMSHSLVIFFGAQSVDRVSLSQSANGHLANIHLDEFSFLLSFSCDRSGRMWNLYRYMPFENNPFQSYVHRILFEGEARSTKGGLVRGWQPGGSRGWSPQEAGEVFIKPVNNHWKIYNWKFLGNFAIFSW